MKEPHSFRVEAVVLRHADWGEADRILTLYTAQRGKVRAIAKAPQTRSRKAGHLEPFTRVTLQLAKGHDLLIVPRPIPWMPTSRWGQTWSRPAMPPMWLNCSIVSPTKTKQKITPSFAC